MTSTLLNDPEQIATLRRQLFNLTDEIVLSKHDWQAMWPFVDNMWVERNASRAKDRQQFNCRIWRNDSDKKAGSGRRNRVRRDVEPCGMKMYVIRKDDNVVISRCPGRTHDVKEHNHDLSYLDKVKTPSAIMRIAADIMSAGKTPGEAVKEIRNLPIVQALEKDGGLYIDTNRVRNAHKASTNANYAAIQRRNFFAAPSSVGAPDTAVMGSAASIGHDPGLHVSCQCGAAQFATPFAKPLDLYLCHCLDCQKQSASAYGTSAIYPADFLFPLSASLRDQLTLYRRPSKHGGTVECYFCKTCGSHLFHRRVEADGTPHTTVSIKGGVIEGLDWANPTHIWTSRAVVSVPPQSWRESPEPSLSQPMNRAKDALAIGSALIGETQEPAKMDSVDAAINPDLPTFSFPS
ncbi:uncharacterized protein PV09_04477 [Verruconis gallopava]|uniref:CENP-V/GFA domain-containing protein n=1 Tax=Verruconis gallopava TaxID=253628 RepID=A0A0D1XQ83_9PEZI|nr:uncharacterized protein PV09_04477 [Verruconis gallopava]KIW04751.1 hypothetical protein PV09_04477 [Verruconis gallopava]